MRNWRGVLMMFVVITAIAGLAAPASAHAAYKSSDPPDDGEVSSPPGEVTATFTEPLADGSFLEITDPCGERVDGGDVRIVGYDMSVSMSGVAAGRYTVAYRAFSTLDPHVTEGTFGFTATSGETCAGEEPPADDGDPPADSADRSGGGSAPAAGSDAAPGQADGGSGQREDGAAGAGSRSGSDLSDGDRAAANRNRVTNVPGGDQQDQVRLAAQEDEEETPSVWEGIRLEPFLTGLLLAAIIGAAGGKMYAGIMGPRA